VKGTNFSVGKCVYFHEVLPGTIAKMEKNVHDRFSTR
jgi:hypothetical protein